MDVKEILLAKLNELDGDFLGFHTEKVVVIAMEDYAEQKAIEFAEWINVNAEKVRDVYYYRLIGRIKVLTLSELYAEFLKQSTK